MRFKNFATNFLAISVIVGIFVFAVAVGLREREQDRLRGVNARGERIRDKPFVASAKLAPFHSSFCEWADKIRNENLVGYDNREQAIKDGHRPCKVCAP